MTRSRHIGAIPAAMALGAFGVLSCERTVIAPGTGSIAIAVTTSGASQDPSGYTITLDGSTSQTVAVNGAVTFSDVGVGSHTVAISEVAANCTVAGGVSQNLAVQENAQLRLRSMLHAQLSLGPLRSRWQRPELTKILTDTPSRWTVRPASP